MKTILRKVARTLFPESAYRKEYFSQEGEDIILAKFIGNQKTKGFYVDIGAHHPIRFSNTYLYYKKGWNGINVDAMPGSMKLFDKLRSRDRNLELAVSNENVPLKYYVFDEPAINGFGNDIAIDRAENSPYKLLKTIDIQTVTLAQLLDKHLPKGQHIDFLTIDVEGLDYNVLQSNNWDKYAPDFVLVEALGTTLNELLSSDIYTYLTARNYQFIAKTFNTCFFRKG